MRILQFTSAQLIYFADLHHLHRLHTFSGEVAQIDSEHVFERVTGCTPERERFGDIVCLRPASSEPAITRDPDAGPRQLNALISSIVLDLSSGEVRVGTGAIRPHSEDPSAADLRVTQVLSQAIIAAIEEHQTREERLAAANAVPDQKIADALALWWSCDNMEGDWIYDAGLVIATAPAEQQTAELDRMREFCTRCPACEVVCVEGVGASLIGPLSDVSSYLVRAARTQAVRDYNLKVADIADALTGEVDYVFEPVCLDWDLDVLDITEFHRYALDDIQTPAMKWLLETQSWRRWSQTEAREFCRAWRKLDLDNPDRPYWERHYLAIWILHESPIKASTSGRVCLEEESANVLDLARRTAWGEYSSHEDRDPDLDRFDIAYAIDRRSDEIWAVANEADFT